MPKKTHGLGRGLDALMPEENTADPSRIQQIPIGDVDPNPHQPRKAFSPESIAALAQSIQDQGMLQPILVTPTSGGRYTIVAGERRWRAAREAGLGEVPCLVMEVTRQEQMEIALIENLQREDLNPLETAQGIRELMDEYGLTQEEVARRLSRSRPSVANLLRILSLPGAVQEMVRQGTLSAGHARVLAGLDSAEEQLGMANETIANGYSVRQLEEICARSRDEKPPRKKREKADAGKTPEMTGFENRIREWSGMRAELRGTEKKGRIILQYYTQEELQHFYDLILRTEGGD